eukprot:CAMPEP_0179018262 /NCGR_PEP_ID=MMETSP0796-20121207/4262_1 /TAXON_ID=73915 /ORGANISM="Pyrodinium bahamense, Strain pbaha01" /LENGTH=813 /DNA_ID=CAMNT_0020714013 /DNA_START=65 /DNA_END=2506 /DNA_ORIENTATION=-
MGGKRKRGGKGGGRGGKGGGRGGRGEEDAADGEPRETGDGERETKRSREGDGDVWRDEPGAWDMSNPAYEAYYKRQCICQDEEWPRLLESLRTGLPVAIRVNRMRPGAPALRSRMAELQGLCGADAERECYAPRPLAWYPHGLAWQWPGLERRVIKKDRRHVQLKEYLAQRERSGIISRQEVVSMLPPLFLGVEPQHLVLDLCAAPGSKTSQMLEMMHWAQAAQKGVSPPSGLVMANELQWRRANMLAHQVQRLGSPCAAVVNMDAQFFPELWAPSSGDGEARRPFRFDRVLCDVPCSGDGTMRKTPYIWKSWTLRDGLALHIRQLNILNRGLDLLKVGGRLVYSTCSLNPMEDEAVVAGALRRHGAAIALVPPRPPLGEQLRAARGLKRWVVPHPREEGVFFESYADVPGELKDGKLKLLPTMFPPFGEGTDGISVQLQEGCRRFLPHLMDTGGFFVATFEKRAELPPSAKARREARAEALREERAAAARAEADEATTAAQAPEAAEVAEEAVEEAAEAAEADVEAATPEAVEEGPPGAGPQEASPPLQGAPAGLAAAPATSPAPPVRQALRRITKEYVGLEQALGAAAWQEIADFYGLGRELSCRFVVRSGGDKGVFLLSEGVQHLLVTETRLPTRMVLCGVLALQRAQSYHVRACAWQLAQEGLAALCALGLRRRISARRPLLRRLLVERDLPLAEVRAAAAAGDVSGLDAMADPESSGDDAGGLLPGSLAVALHGDDVGANSDGLPLVVAATISDDALELAANNAEVAALLEDLCGQPSVDGILGGTGASAVAEAGAADEAPRPTANEP